MPARVDAGQALLCRQGLARGRAGTQTHACSCVANQPPRQAERLDQLIKDHLPPPPPVEVNGLVWAARREPPAGWAARANESE